MLGAFGGGLVLATILKRLGSEQEQKIGQTVQDVTERMSVLVREEIELAKAEVTVKAKKSAPPPRSARPAGSSSSSPCSS